MISSLLLNAGLRPTTAVGGIINNGSSYNAHLGEGKYFVAEVDESDGTFLYFHPRYSVVTNIDYEHVDFYKNWEGILEAWQKFILCTDKDGCVIAYGEDPHIKNLLSSGHRRAITYGFADTNDFYAHNIEVNGFSSSFDCFSKEKGKLRRIELIVPGRHNILNALACVALGEQLGIGIEVTIRTLKEFGGVKRRFQLKGDLDGVMVIDDYGHHPTEVTADRKSVV